MYLRHDGRCCTRPWSIHPQRSVSGAPPRRARFANEIRGRPSEIYRGSPRDLFEDLLGQRPRDLAFENLPDVGGDGLAPLSGASDQLTMQAIWNAPHLDHLGHAPRMPHAWHMRKRRRSGSRKRTRPRRAAHGGMAVAAGARGGCTIRATADAGVRRATPVGVTKAKVAAS